MKSGRFFENMASPDDLAAPPLANKFGDSEKKRRAKEDFDGNHFKAETIMLRILMMEKRLLLLSALKQIDREKMPDGPIKPRYAAFSGTT